MSKDLVRVAVFLGVSSVAAASATAGSAGSAAAGSADSATAGSAASATAGSAASSVALKNNLAAGGGASPPEALHHFWSVYLHRSFFILFLIKSF